MSISFNHLDKVSYLPIFKTIGIIDKYEGDKEEK